MSWKGTSRVSAPREKIMPVSVTCRSRTVTFTTSLDLWRIRPEYVACQSPVTGPGRAIEWLLRRQYVPL